MQKIKVFIPSYNRAEKICSHLLFQHNPRYEVKIVLHSEEQKELYLKEKPELVDLLVVSGVPNSENIGGQRRWIRNQVKQDEWYISMDDDVHGISRVIDNLYDLPNLSEEQSKNADNFKHIMNEKELDEFIDKSISECEYNNVKLYGCAALDNTLFRATKIQSMGFIIGVFFIEKKDESIQLNPQIKIKEDVDLTAQHLLKIGRVIKNNFVKPVHKMYNPGGVGSKLSRKPLNEEVAKILIDQYDGLFTYKGDDKSEVVISLRSQDKLKLWRLKMIVKGKLDISYAKDILKDPKQLQQFIEKYAPTKLGKQNV